MNSRTPRDPLAGALSRWRLVPPRDRNFRAAVWQRIAGGQGLTWSGYLRAHVVGWSVAAMIALVAAGWSGYAIAEARLASDRETIVVSYLNELDPRVVANLRQ